MTDAVSRFKAEKVDGRKHFARLRRGICCRPGCMNQDLVVHHDRHSNEAGTGLKPPPWTCVGICTYDHAILHQRGRDTCEREWGIDFAMIARGEAMDSRGMGLLPREEQS